MYKFLESSFIRILNTSSDLLCYFVWKCNESALACDKLGDA